MQLPRHLFGRQGSYWPWRGCDVKRGQCYKQNRWRLCGWACILKCQWLISFGVKSRNEAGIHVQFDSDTYMCWNFHCFSEASIKTASAQAFFTVLSPSNRHHTINRLSSKIGQREAISLIYLWYCVVMSILGLRPPMEDIWFVTMLWTWVESVVFKWGRWH